MEFTTEGKNMKVLDRILSFVEELQQLPDTNYNKRQNILNEIQQLCFSNLCLPRRKRFPNVRWSNISVSSSNSDSSDAEGIKQTAYEEKCMRESIQHHITTLVNTLFFKESKIPDMIIQHGMATSSECEKLRKLPTLEDQVSGLVSMVIQRDISCMRHFLDIVKEQNPCVVNEILETFDYSTQNSNMVALPCVACELKQKCDIKSVYNHFFEEKLISYSLHSKIVYDPSPIGAQATVWDELLNELEEQPAAHVVNIFIKALNDNNFHSNLIHMLKRLLRKKRSVKCRCQYQSLVDNRQNRTVNKDCTDQTNENYAYTINTVARQEVETQAEDSVNTHRSYNSESTTDPKEVYTERKSNIHEVNTQNNRSYNLESTEDNTEPKKVCTERKSNIHEVNTQNDRSYNSESTVDNTDPKEVYTERKSNIYKAIWPSTSDLERKSNIQEVSQQNNTSYNSESTEDTTYSKELCTERKSNIYEAIWPSALDSPLQSKQSYELTSDETTPETATLMVNNITPTAASQEINKDEPKPFMTKDKLSGNEERSGLQKKTKCRRNQYDIKKMKQIYEDQMATDRMTHL